MVAVVGLYIMALPLILYASNQASNLSGMASVMIPLALASPSWIGNKASVRMRMPIAANVSHFEAATVGPPHHNLAANVSHFGGMPKAPQHPTSLVQDAYEASTNVMKLNLDVRAYRTDELQPYVLNCVKKAESIMLEKCEDKEYLPVEGLDVFNKVTAELLFGANNPVIQDRRVATVQSVAGTGSLRLAAEFIRRYFPEAQVLISSPTWDNHRGIFSDATVPWSLYRYYNPTTEGLDFEGMITDLKAAPERSFILLHGCAHNPTGIDPTPEQWQKIADTIQEKSHIPFFDMAYQGFATGNLDADASAVKLFTARGLELLVAQSYGKNMGLYSERVGALNVVCSSSEAATSVRSQLRILARPMYSNPPVHGARIVTTVVGDPNLYNEWNQEMELIAARVQNIRQAVFEHLSSKDNSGKDWSFIRDQVGIFSFLTLSDAQYDNMANKWNVYMRRDGRISIAGVPLSKCEYLADAIIDTIHNVS